VFELRDGRLTPPLAIAALWETKLIELYRSGILTLRGRGYRVSIASAHRIAKAAPRHPPRPPTQRPAPSRAAIPGINRNRPARRHPFVPSLCTLPWVWTGCRRDAAESSDAFKLPKISLHADRTEGSANDGESPQFDGKRDEHAVCLAVHEFHL